MYQGRSPTYAHSRFSQKFYANPTIMNVDVSLENSVTGRNKIENDKVSEMLSAGIKAAQAGNRREARTALLKVTEADAVNENAWLWLASISEYPEELLVFLKNVLTINPANERALEWSKATKALLAKTFVQRGIDAHKQTQTDFAKQCFLQAIFNDDENELAWLWLASTTEAVEEKMSHLHKVLRINPDNTTAQASLAAAESQTRENLMRKANAAAVSGRHEEANIILDEILQTSPDIEDAWILKSYLTNSFDEKLEYFEKVLEINPANETAQASVNSLRLMKSAVEAKEAEQENKLNFESLKNEETENTNLEQSEELIVTKENQAAKQIEQPAPAFAEIAVAETEQLYFSEPEPQFAENIFESEPLELESGISVSDYDQNYEEVLESEESAKEDFYSQNSNEVTAEFSEDNFAEELQTDSPEIIEPYKETAAESDYSDFDAPAEEDSQENKSEETLEFQPENAETEEVAIDESIVENLETHSNGNGTAAHHFEAEQLACPFCHAENDVQAFVCEGCNAVLTLSDLEMLLAHKDADAEMLRRAVEQMKSEEIKGGLDDGDLTMLGIGCINLDDLQNGLKYLRKAARSDTNNVLLNSQVDSLAIRLAEIEEQESIHRTMPQNRTIMVVDDSATVRKLISGKLEKSGHTVVCAVDGVEALEKLRELTPDLILLDITMPRMDGYQVCKLIRNNDEMKDIPVVMISGKDGFFDKVRGRMAGTTGYITKPFGPETLMKTVEAFVSQKAEMIDEEEVIG